MQRSQRGEELAVRRVAKTADADVAHRGGSHVVGIHGLHGHIAAQDVEGKEFAVAGTFHFQPRVRTLRALQALHGAVVGDGVAHILLAVDGDDAVTRKQSHLLRGAALDDFHHAYGVAEDGELHTDAREAAFQVLHGLLHLRSGDVGRVRVELFQNLGQRILHEVGDIDRVHILVVDEVEKVHHLVARVVDDAQSVARKVVGEETS